MQDIAQWPAGATAAMNVTYTQANAAGGAVVCEVSPGSGSEFIVLDYRIVNSGTNGIQVNRETALGGTTMAVFSSVASAAGTTCNISVGTVNNAFTAANNAGLGYPVIISGNQALRLSQTVAGAQNDTFQILCNIRTRGGVPSVTHANSTNPANVSVTAGTEAFVTL